MIEHGPVLFPAQMLWRYLFLRENLQRYAIEAGTILPPFDSGPSVGLFQQQPITWGDFS
jgi:hypothetical protein